MLGSRWEEAATQRTCAVIHGGAAGFVSRNIQRAYELGYSAQQLNRWDTPSGFVSWVGGIKQSTTAWLLVYAPNMQALAVGCDAIVNVMMWLDAICLWRCGLGSDHS